MPATKAAIELRILGAEFRGAAIDVERQRLVGTVRRSQQQLDVRVLHLAVLERRGGEVRRDLALPPSIAAVASGCDIDTVSDRARIFRVAEFLRGRHLQDDRLHRDLHGRQRDAVIVLVDPSADVDRRIAHISISGDTLSVLHTLHLGGGALGLRPDRD
jgi:hypothetical protein